MKYVIIGNSAAGIGAAEGIRQIDRGGEITIVAGEPYHAYSRPLISYLLLGKTTEQKMNYRNETFYLENKISLFLGVTATAIDPGGKKISLSGAGCLPYDKLLVATGSSAVIPPLEGLDRVKNKYTFLSLDDAKKLNEKLHKNTRILIIGAGLIGLKCAEGILDKTGKITVIDLAPRILPGILDDEGAKLVQNHLENKGIEFKLPHSVRRFTENVAELDDGAKIEFDVLVLAAGVRPNTEILQNIAAIEKGIVVNSKGQTSQPDIYAAGDCAQSLDVSSGESKIMALWPNAYMAGECAGINMAGGEKEFDKALPMNAAGFFGLQIITAGNYTGNVYQKSEGHNYKKLFYSGNRLNGYILIGDKPDTAKPPVYDKAGIYTALIRERTLLDTLDFDLICQKPGLMAFTKEYRKINLGGGV